jgi:aspartate aminotransferase
MKFAERVQSLSAEGAYFMLSRAQALEAAGRSIIHLEIGQPDFPTFSNISRAGMRAIESGQTLYTPSAGVKKLREAIARDAGQRRGMQIQPEQVVVAPGAKPALFFPILALIQAGDEVIYPDPGFPTYAASIRVAGGVPVPVPLCETQNFSFDLEAFDAVLSPRTRMVIINSPGNPTGGVMSPDCLHHIAQKALERDFWVLSDEVYARLVFDGLAVPSIAALPDMADRTILCDGFSKTYAMTGWRLGFGIMPPLLAERMELLLTHSVGCTASFTQYAGLEALMGPQEAVSTATWEYQRRRDVVVDRLNAIPGIQCRSPQGAFYAFPNITALGKTSAWWADYFLEAAGVAVLPGTAFGAGGEGFLRLCFANSIPNLLLALERMAEAVTQLYPEHAVV